MFVYVGRTYTSTLTGRRLMEVRCEKCSANYYYEMLRVATGSGSSPYMLNNAGAANRAASGARKNLDALLARGTDPVPCPHCGWFQAEMVRDARQRRHRWMGWLTLGVPGLILFIALCAWLGSLGDR